MKVATTKQFRNAVRQALKELDITVHGSWTDAPRWASRASGVRIVAFEVRVGADAVADRTEKILVEQGLTAKTRATGYLNSWGGAYVRGTCELL